MPNMENSIIFYFFNLKPSLSGISLHTNNAGKDELALDCPHDIFLPAVVVDNGYVVIADVPLFFV